MTTTNTVEGGGEIILKRDSLGRVKMPYERREALLDEFERSGMSGQAFAEWAGIKYPTFSYWRQQRRNKQKVSKKVEDGEMKWVEAEVAQRPKVSSKILVIHFSSGVRVEATCGKDAAEMLLALGVKPC